MSKKGGSGASFQKDVPWRASSSTAKPFPKIHHSPLLRVSQTPFTDYAVSVMRHPDPIGSGLGDEAIVEAAGPDCLVPGQKMPLQLLGLQVLFFLFFCLFSFFKRFSYAQSAVFLCASSHIQFFPFNLIDGFLPDFQSLLL
ncbi:hypothetical protein VIGAN_04333900 [Vigna angularis var. angularis]|uniref:Uncharacterized protein n=1 Tax=Vigna angularis var. angularis TaxID=157739 RepID=A0A0S3RYT9_PHAAN|nr:hypothetical protein VIGAN_04333900 [Vigna angularis var. angularis]